MPTSSTATGIAYDREGPRGPTSVVFVHAGVADRQMWDPQWAELAATRDCVRLDLRGFGESVRRPVGSIDYLADVVDTLVTLDIRRAHLVGASLGAGVCVELALTRPDLVASLVLSAPGGWLITERTAQLAAFGSAENAALDRGDLDGAVEANLAWWVDGPDRDAGEVDPGMRASVGKMQRRAFELTAEWDDVFENQVQLDPPAVDRLAEVRQPTLVLVGGLDLDAIHDTARRLTDEIPTARRVDWPDVAHLPSMERPAEFTALLTE